MPRPSAETLQPAVVSLAAATQVRPSSRSLLEVTEIYLLGSRK